MSLSFLQISEERLPELCDWDSLCFPGETWTKKMLRTHLEFHVGYVWQETKVKGYVLICETPWEVEIFRIATLPTYQRQGVGKSMLNELFKKFPKKEFYLEVKEQNEPAINLYKKTAFEILEVRKNYYPDGSNAILMKRKPIE